MCHFSLCSGFDTNLRTVCASGLMPLPTQNTQVQRSHSIDEYSVHAGCDWIESMEGPDCLPRGQAFTEYAARQSHEMNHAYTSPHHAMPHYQSPSSVSYMAANVQYSPVATTYSGYSPAYHSSSHHIQPMMYVGNPAGSSMGYHVRPPTPKRHSTFATQNSLSNILLSTQQSQSTPSASTCFALGLHHS